MYIQFICIYPIEMHIYICAEINYEESTHAMMKAVKSRNLPCASQRKVGGVVLQYKSKAPQTRVSGVEPTWARMRKDCYPHSGRQAKAKGVSSFFLHLYCFYTDPQQIGGCPPHWGRQATLLSPPTQIPFSPRNTLDRHSEVVLIQSSLWDCQGGT